MRFKILVLLLCGGLMQSYAKMYSFSVEITEPSQVDIITTIELAKFANSESGNPALFRIDGSKRTPVPSQVDGKKLVWIIEGPVRAGIIHYEIGFGNTKDALPQMKAVKEGGQLLIKSGEQNLLSYHFETVYPPEGIDTAYKRSAFIHPLWTPNGQVLTRIQPPDHYHHYGIWNPWTRVLFEGDTIDFWNLRDRKGTVRFAGFTQSTEGQVFSEYEALHQHIVFKKDGSEKVALNEWQKVRVYKPHNDRYLVDVTIKYQCAGDSPFNILEYRYAGLGWRATGEWDNQNSRIFTSEGNARETADGSLAKWFVYQGKLGNDSGGMAWLSDPSNYNHPEPIRIWPVKMNDRGDVFANFAPTKNKDWLLEPGKTYTLKYRFIVFNGTLSPEEAGEAWDYFSTDLNIKY
jgi:hypothetical protein